jgi:hypothetical protein
MLGGTPDQRRENYDVLRDLYDLRSQIAHEGSIVERAAIPTRDGQERLSKARKRASSGQRVCTELIIAVIRHGSLPDWDQLMFGW